MTIQTARLNQLSDYSLVGKDTNKAIQAGLAEATWYSSPVSKTQIRDLLERRDAPALAGIALWFSLLIGFGVGHVVGHYPLILLRCPICLDLRRALARNGAWHSLQDRLDEQCGLRDCVIYGVA